jgi:hypothetical protein
MKLALAGMLALASVSCTQHAASPMRRGMLPPPEYDHAYSGKLTVVTVPTLAALHQACRGPVSSVACARALSGHCTIFRRDLTEIARLGWNQADVMRHEIGHCNGWPAHHPNGRPIFSAAR